MAVIGTSARGEVVDFDLLRIKQTLASSPAPTEVAARENFIERRLSRRARLAQQQLEEIAAAGEYAAVNQPAAQQAMIDAIGDDVAEEVVEESIEQPKRSRSKKQEAVEDFEQE